MSTHRRSPAVQNDGIEARFFHEAPLMVCLASLDGHFTSLGGPWQAVLGWTEQELMSRPFLDLVHPDDLVATLAQLEGLARGETTVRFRNRYRAKSGAWVVLQWDSHVSEQGAVLAVAQDVTVSVARDLELERRTVLREVVGHMQQRYIREGWSGLSFNDLIESLLQLTDSAFGFLAFRPTSFGAKHELELSGFRSHRPELMHFEPAWLTLPGSPWAAVAGSVLPLIRNSPVAGIPPEIPVAVESFLGLPVLGNGGVVGLLALFNRPGGFDEEWVKLLMPFCSAVAPMHELDCVKERELHLQSEVHRWTDLFAAAIESTGVVVIATDLDGRITYMNPTAQRMLGATLPEQITSTSLVSFHDPAELADAMRGCTTLNNRIPGTDFEVLVCGTGDGRARREWTYVSLSGIRYPMMVTISPLRAQDGGTVGWVAVAAELSELRAAQSERVRAAQLEGQLEILRRREVETAKISEAYEYVSASRSLREALAVISAFLPLIFGEAAPQLLIPRVTSRPDAPSADGVDADGDSVEAHECWGFKTGQVFVSEVGSLRCAHIQDDQSTWVCAPLADGLRTVAVLTMPLPNQNGGGVSASWKERNRRIASLSDQARQFSGGLANLRLRKTLEEQATQDPLTGAINRRQLDHELRITLHRHLKTHAPFALMVLDVDHFKRINDEFGHERGDRVLAGLGALLRNHLRITDVVARVGGEEFVVLLREAAKADALELADSLCTAIDQARLAGEGLRCTCSIGLVHVELLQSTVDELFRHADQALYAAKAAGRNRVVVYSESVMSLEGLAPSPAGVEAEVSHPLIIEV